MLLKEKYVARKHTHFSHSLKASLPALNPILEPQTAPGNILEVVGSTGFTP